MQFHYCTLVTREPEQTTLLDQQSFWKQGGGEGRGGGGGGQRQRYFLRGMVSKLSVSFGYKMIMMMIHMPPSMTQN